MVEFRVEKKTCLFLLIAMLSLSSTWQIQALSQCYNRHVSLFNKVPSVFLNDASKYPSLTSTSQRRPTQRMQSLAIDCDDQERKDETTTYQDLFALERLYRGVSIDCDDQEKKDESTYRDRLTLQRLYSGISLLHFFEAGWAVKESGGLFTLGGLNAMGGPLMAAGVLNILSHYAKHCSKTLLSTGDTFKQLNGVMALYASMALVGGIAAFDNITSAGLLSTVAASGALFVAAKGYFVGLRNVDDCRHLKKKKFFPETVRLFRGAARITTMVPFSSSKGRRSWGDFALLLSVATKKASLFWGILQVVLFSLGLPLSMPSQMIIAPKLGQLTKLTILGGSIVTTLSIEDNSDPEEGGQRGGGVSTIVPLRMSASYVFLTMGVYDIAKASKPMELVVGSIYAACAIVSAIKGLRHWRRRVR